MSAGRSVGALAAIISIGAGVYLLLSGSSAEETTVFDAIMDGMGAYFIARGLFMISTLAHRGGRDEGVAAGAAFEERD